MCSSSYPIQELVSCQCPTVLTNMMTPQMLITIPQAAIFGPQNSSDGMSALNCSILCNFYFNSTTEKRPFLTVVEAPGRSADPQESGLLGKTRLTQHLGVQSENATRLLPTSFRKRTNHLRHILESVKRRRSADSFQFGCSRKSSGFAVRRNTVGQSQRLFVDEDSK